MYKHYKGLTPGDNESEVILNPFGRVVYWRQSPMDAWEPVGVLKGLRLRIHPEKCMLLKEMTKDELVLELM
jgi:hypothetical protein